MIFLAILGANRPVTLKKSGASPLFFYAQWHMPHPKISNFRM
jgi:hypothetical protein